MAILDELVTQIENPELRARITAEVEKLAKQKKFGLVFEEHLPECTPLWDIPVKAGRKAAIKTGHVNDFYTVLKIEDGVATCLNKDKSATAEFSVEELVCVAEFGEPIYPYLKPIDTVCNAPDSDLWHTLIEADNYHALQLLEYLYAGKVDCIYIDPPYNTGARDWKYNNDYVDGNDQYRHSKWLSMMQKRLKLAKKLLNPTDSVLIVTIDEKEYLHLGCLLEEMFPEARMQMISALTNSRGVARESGFARVDEYIYILQLGCSAVNRLPLSDEWRVNMKSDQRVTHLRWSMLIRSGSHFLRADSPNQFYPIFVYNDSNKIHSVGESYYGDTRNEVTPPDGTFAVWPLRKDGAEGNWQISNENLRALISSGYVMLGRKANNTVPIYYLKKGEIAKVKNGTYEISGYREDGSIISDTEVRSLVTGTQWRIKSHDASIGGTLSPKSMRNMRVVLDVALKQALAEGVIGSNPVPLTAVRAVHKPRVQILTDEAQAKLEEYLFSHRHNYHAGILLVMFTGMRLGEVCALQWKDYDPGTGRLRIGHTVRRQTNYDAAEGESRTVLVTNETKSDTSDRTLTMPPILQELLENQRTRYAHRFHIPTGEDYIVFCGKGTMVDPDNLTHYFARLLKKLGLPHVKFHAMRHTFATRAIENGIDVATVSGLLGHADVTTTTHFYVQPREAAMDQAMRRITPVSGGSFPVANTTEPTAHINH